MSNRKTQRRKSNSKPRRKSHNKSRGKKNTQEKYCWF